MTTIRAYVRQAAGIKNVASATNSPRPVHFTSSRQAFTLIELLIVVLIIAILAAIAVPNFLEFQTRAKVSRAKSDMRAMATAIEAYLVDNNVYPLDGDDLDPFNPANFDVTARLRVITTPISYITSLFPDPFHTEDVDMGMAAILFPNPPPFTFIYNTYGSFTGNPMMGPGPENAGNPDNYTLTSLGPSRAFDSQLVQYSLYYDPTNGTVSVGDIHRHGGTRVVLETSM